VQPFFFRALWYSRDSRRGQARHEHFGLFHPVFHTVEKHCGKSGLGRFVIARKGRNNATFDVATPARARKIALARAGVNKTLTAEFRIDQRPDFLGHAMAATIWDFLSSPNTRTKVNRHSFHTWFQADEASPPIRARRLPFASNPLSRTGS